MVTSADTIKFFDAKITYFGCGILVYLEFEIAKLQDHGTFCFQFEGNEYLNRDILNLLDDPKKPIGQMIGIEYNSGYVTALWSYDRTSSVKFNKPIKCFIQ